jgi:hypothetical protein
MGWFLLRCTRVFSHLTAREQYRKVTNRTFYLFILQNEIFIKFSSHDKKKSLSFLVPVTHNGIFLQFAQTPCAQFRHSCYRTYFSTPWSSVKKPAQYKHSASSSSSHYSHYPSSSSDPEETPHSLGDKIGGFTSLLPVFSTGLMGLFFHRKGTLFCCFPFIAYCFSQKGLVTG